MKNDFFLNSRVPEMQTNTSILFTIDVEDWFQVENFKTWIPFSSWPNYELRVENNIDRILDLLGNRRATFFILAWIAERLPHLIKKIHNSGHEIASHGYDHKLCHKLSPNELKQDLLDSKKLLEDIIGAPVKGYRAPSFSIGNDILKSIEDCGFLYDSSYNSFAMHDRYGHVELPIKERRGIAHKISDNFYELPVSNFMIGKYAFPLAGGGYFRLIPFFLFREGIRNILKKDKTYLFYMHPWEIDHEQPRMAQASALYKFRHYVNLDKTSKKIQLLFNAFKNTQFITCNDYIDEVRLNS
jgi:polysaccharide deacetylase family protein (PEP-CTERM system associated)